MKNYEVHFGFELPFWLALPEGEYMVAVKRDATKLSITNIADRLEAGDPYLLKGGIIRVLSPQARGEQARTDLKGSYPQLPVTRHPLKTLVTHVREASCADDAELLRLYHRRKRAWYRESLRVVNRLIDAYQEVVTDDTLRGHASRVAPWDLDRFVTSLWDTDAQPRRQVTGLVERELPEMPRPSPVPRKVVDALRQLLADPAELPIPLPQVLNAGALSKIVRGDYRGAVVDDVTALEFSVEISFRSLAAGRLPPEIIESLLSLHLFPELCCKWLPAIGGPQLTEDWGDIAGARKIRNGVVHQGKRATEHQARVVHDVCTAGLQRLSRTLQARHTRRKSSGARRGKLP